MNVKYVVSEKSERIDWTDFRVQHYTASDGISLEEIAKDIAAEFCRRMHESTRADKFAVSILRSDGKVCFFGFRTQIVFKSNLVTSYGEDE